MAQNRTYLVRMPTDSGSMPFLDILLQGPVGSVAAPVGVGASTPAPAGWGVGGQFFLPSDGIFCEWRSRTFRVPILFGQPGFVPRLRLGWNLMIVPNSLGDGCSGIPMYRLSSSLVGDLPLDFADLSSPDPSYGNGQNPVIRLINTPDVEGGSFVVNFSSFEAKDEDRNPTGV